MIVAKINLRTIMLDDHRLQKGDLNGGVGLIRDASSSVQFSHKYFKSLNNQTSILLEVSCSKLASYITSGLVLVSNRAKGPCIDLLQG